MSGDPSKITDTGFSPISQKDFFLFDLCIDNWSILSKKYIEIIELYLWVSRWKG